MSLFKIAWRSIQQRWVASLLTAISMALGVAMVVAVLLVLGVVQESFRSNSALGYNMIIGAKGGDLQLVLNTVFYLSAPVENIPYSLYEEFLPAVQRHDNRDGTYSDFVEFAIPLCLGDYYRGFRVVGTTPAMFDNFVYDRDQNRKYEFASGRNLQTKSDEYGYFEAVVGWQVAKKSGLKVGDAFSPTHGPEGDAHDEFFVVGILAQSGTPNDRAVFVNMEGFFLLEGHAKINESEDTSAASEPSGAASGTMADAESAAESAGGVSRLTPERQRLQPLPLEQREVTALMIQTTAPYLAPGLKTTINEGVVGRAVTPISEIYELFRTFVDPMKWLLLLLTVLICVVSGVSILVSIYNSMNDRKHDIAVMRALGAGRRTVMTVILLESILLAFFGGVAGWMAGHVLVGGLARPLVEDRTGVTIGLFDLAPPIRPFALLGESPIMRSVATWEVSSEFLLIPGLMILAVVVGFLPAVAAYRTDVARALV